MSYIKVKDRYYIFATEFCIPLGYIHIDQKEELIKQMDEYIKAQKRK